MFIFQIFFAPAIAIVALMDMKSFSWSEFKSKYHLINATEQAKKFDAEYINKTYK